MLDLYGWILKRFILFILLYYSLIILLIILQEILYILISIDISKLLVNLIYDITILILVQECVLRSKIKLAIVYKTSYIYINSHTKNIQTLNTPLCLNIVTFTFN